MSKRARKPSRAASKSEESPRLPQADESPRISQKPGELPPPWQYPDAMPEPLDIFEIFISVDEHRLVLRRGRADGAGILAGFFLIVLPATALVLITVFSRQFGEGMTQAILFFIAMAATGIGMMYYELAGWGESPVVFDRIAKRVRWYDTQGFWRLQREAISVEWETLVVRQRSDERPDAFSIYTLEFRRPIAGDFRWEVLTQTQNFRNRPREAWKAIRLFMMEGIEVTRNWTFEPDTDVSLAQRLHRSLRWLLPTAQGRAYRNSLRHAFSAGGTVLYFMIGIIGLLWIPFATLELDRQHLAYAPPPDFPGALAAAQVVSEVVSGYTLLVLLTTVIASIVFGLGRSYVRSLRDRRARLAEAMAATTD